MIKVNSAKQGNAITCEIVVGGMGIEIITELGYIVAHILTDMCKGETKDLQVPLSMFEDVAKIAVDEIVELW